MKFLLDAHLPRRLCILLSERGHDAIHTLNLSVLARHLPVIEQVLQTHTLVEVDRSSVIPVI